MTWKAIRRHSWRTMEMSEVAGHKDFKEPDWRYREACAFIKNVDDGSAVILPSDPVVQLLVRGIKGLLCVNGKTGNKYTRGYTRAAWPVTSKVLYLGTLAKDSATAGLLDICIMKGFDHGKAKAAGMPLGKAVYDLYKLAFFDVDKLMEAGCLRNDYLFDRVRNSIHAAGLRMVACFGDADDDGLNMAQGLPMTSGESSTAQKLMRSRRRKQLLDYVLEERPLPAEVKAGFMETALKAAEDREFQRALKEEDDKGSASLEDLAAHIEEGIRAFSQSEIAGQPKDGVDFTNQYTKSNISQS